MNSEDVIKVSEEHLLRLFEAVGKDSDEQGPASAVLRSVLKGLTYRFIPGGMDDEFYKGMISALLTVRTMLPDFVNTEHGLFTLQEFTRFVTLRLMDERVRRSMEGVTSANS